MGRPKRFHGVHCCRCNRSGCCQNCLCVKSGRVCQGCLPQRLGNCVNTIRTPLSQAADMAPSLSQISTQGPGSSSSSLSPSDTHLVHLLSFCCLLITYLLPPALTCRLAVCLRLRHAVPPLHCLLSFPCFRSLWYLPLFGVPTTLSPSLTSLVLFIVKLYTGGQIFSNFPLANHESSSFLNLQECMKHLPQALPWNWLLLRQLLFYLFCCYRSLPPSQKPRNTVHAWTDGWEHGLLGTWMI